MLSPHSNPRTKWISHPRRSGGCGRIVCRHWAYMLGKLQIARPSFTPSFVFHGFFPSIDRSIARSSSLLSFRLFFRSSVLLFPFTFLSPPILHPPFSIHSLPFPPLFCPLFHPSIHFLRWCKALIWGLIYQSVILTTPSD